MPSEERVEGDIARQSLGQRIAIALLLAYKVGLSPVIPSACRFYPTCSDYATEAFQRHGVGKGFSLTAGRLLRCRPFSPGGVDLVPESLTDDA